jgi:hypothetical protein
MTFGDELFDPLEGNSEYRDGRDRTRLIQGNGGCSIGVFKSRVA